jgi:hypothetical protein
MQTKPQAMYMFSVKSKEKKCCMGQVNESWLWHRRMGHINFGNILKLNKTQAIRDMPRISKPTNTICKPC